jgi:hypothetical protein
MERQRELKRKTEREKSKGTKKQTENTAEIFERNNLPKMF